MYHTHGVKIPNITVFTIVKATTYFSAVLCYSTPLKQSRFLLNRPRQLKCLNHYTVWISYWRTRERNTTQPTLSTCKQQQRTAPDQQYERGMSPND